MKDVPRSRASRRRTRCRCWRRSGARTSSTTTTSCYAGHLSLGMPPHLQQRMKAADLIIALGTRLGDINTMTYSLLQPPRLAARLVHVHADPAELNRVYQADLAIAAVTLSGRGPARRTGAVSCSALDAPGPSRPGASIEKFIQVPAERPASRRRPGRRHPASGDTSSRERDPLERCRQFHRLGAPVLYVPAAADRTGADERRDGLRLPCIDCGKPAAPRPGELSASPGTAIS